MSTSLYVSNLKSMRNVSGQYNRPMLMLSTSRSVPSLAKLFAAVALFPIAFSAFGDPAVDVLDQTDARVQSVIAAQDEVTPSLMQRPEILGTAGGRSETGTRTLMSYVNR